MKFEYNEINYKKFGKCLEITNGFLTLIVSLEYGPRILSFSSTEAENILYEDDEFKSLITFPETEAIFGKGNVFYLRGGHRMWVAPETWYTYYPDNEEVHYDVIGDKVILYQPIQKINNYKLRLEIEFKEKNLVHIKHILKNKDKISKKLAPWGITVLKGPGLEIIPMPKEDMGFVPQRHISIWAYGAKANDERLYFGDKFSSLEFDVNKFEPIKVGFRVTDNYALYMTETSVFVKKFIFNKDFIYPDNNVNYESYTNGLILEMETVGELKDILPDEEVEHNEFWSLYKNNLGIPEKNNESQYESFIKKIF